MTLTEKKIRFRLIPVLFLLLFCWAGVLAQTGGKSGTVSAKREILNSKMMAREMPYNIILPEGYSAEKSKSQRYPVIYLLHGLFGHFDNWANNTKLTDYAASYQFIIVMPEGNNGWYTDSATVEDDKYESYIVKELIPEIDRIYRTKAEKRHRAIAGLSMGGYGALKFGLKYPEMFALAGSFSGAVNITDATDVNSPDWVAKSVMGVYGGAEAETRKNNDIFRIVRELSAEKIKNLPFIYLDCGTEDFLIAGNRDFLKLLNEKKVSHEYRELPGVHDWKFWNGQIEEFLQISQKFISHSE
ncbi:MAG: alpha/beta hydrolase family protein [Pyrinomonadaceae bacterium]